MDVTAVCLGVPVNSRVSTKIQQLLNTLKRPKRPPLSEFFLDDSEEIVEGMKCVFACSIFGENIYSYYVFFTYKCLYAYFLPLTLILD